MKCTYCNNEIEEEGNYCKSCDKVSESTGSDKLDKKGKEKDVVKKIIEQKDISSIAKSSNLKKEITNKKSKKYYKRHLNNPFIAKWLIPVELIISLILTYAFYLIITSSIQNSYIINSNQELLQNIKNDSLSVGEKEAQQIDVIRNESNTIENDHKNKQNHFITISKRLFDTNSNSILWIIPYLILGVFIFLIIDILFKLGFSLTIKRQLNKINVNQFLEDLKTIKGKTDFKINYGNVYYFQIVKKYVRTVLSVLLYRLEFGKKENNNDENLRQLTDDECSKALNSFSLPKLLIWAMPILGFIGTVVGIGLAIGNLSGFLEGDIEDVAKVKEGLANISTGLSYAFDTTLLGLAASLISMIPTTYAQNLVVSVYSEFELLSEELAEEHRNFNEEYSGIPSTDLEESVESLKKRANDLQNALSLSNNNLNNITQELSNSVALTETSFKSLQDTLQNSISNQTSLVDKISAVTNSINTQNININKGFSELNETNINYIKTLQDNNELTKNLTAMVATMSNSQEKITELLYNLDGGFEFKFVRPKNNP